MRADHAGRGVLTAGPAGGEARRHDGLAPVRDGLFTCTDDPRLLGSRCRACGRHQFPRQDTCPYCGTDGTEPVELSPRARLWAWTAVTTTPPGYRGAVPYGFGVVELDEGIRVITRLTEPDPTALHAGQAMRLVLVPLETGGDDGTALGYAFAPDEAGSPGAGP